MKTLIPALALSLCLLAAGPAIAKKQSQNIEFGSISCNDFVQGLAEMDAEGAGLVLVWLDGYLSGVSGDTKLDWDNLSTIGESLVEHCSANPDDTFLDAAKEVGID
ncbi:MAG: hypothetical protein HQL47_06540 [Gammaproteobacteria bacterium]|nr:hypothetical protein [Gammaproteobacteria bacterium]